MLLLLPRQRDSIPLEFEKALCAPCAPRRQSPPFRAEERALESMIPRRFVILVCVSAETTPGIWLRKARIVLTGATMVESAIATDDRILFSMVTKRLRLHCGQFLNPLHCVTVG